MSVVKDKFLVECVANISEGRDEQRLARILTVFDEQEKVKLLHVDSGVAANRSVLTIIGPYPELAKVVKSLYIKVLDELDMRKHNGNHPRIGAIDVCPLIPLDIKDKEKLIKEVEGLGREIAKTIKAPVFLYADSSKGKNRSLPNVRNGGYERLISKPESMNFSPDFGKAYINERFGGSVIGVRDFMLAYNVNLETTDLSVAKKVASDMRGIRKKDGVYNGRDIKPLQILGWYVEEFGKCQISTNIHNPRELSMVDVYNFTTDVAKKYDVKVNGSELIGMIPQVAVDLITPQMNREEIENSLGLDFKGSFDLNERILESMYRKNSD